LHGMANAFKLPPAHLEWTEEDGYSVEVEDEWDVFYAFPRNAKAALVRKRQEAWKAALKGGKAVWEMVSEKVLPGLERALYDTSGDDDLEPCR